MLLIDKEAEAEALSTDFIIILRYLCEDPSADHQAEPLILEGILIMLHGAHPGLHGPRSFTTLSGQLVVVVVAVAVVEVAVVAIVVVIVVVMIASVWVQMHNIDELKQSLLNGWYGTDQSVTDDAFDKWH